MSSTDTINRNIGQIKWFNTRAGFGFITCSHAWRQGDSSVVSTVPAGSFAGQDMFVHFSGITVTSSQYKYLVQGEYVEFDIVKPEGDSKHEYHAVNVTGIAGGRLMCEARTEAMKSVPEKSVRRSRVRKNNLKNEATGAEPKEEVVATEKEGEFKKVARKRSNKNKRVVTKKTASEPSSQL